MNPPLINMECASSVGTDQKGKIKSIDGANLRCLSLGRSLSSAPRMLIDDFDHHPNKNLNKKSFKFDTEPQT